MKWCGLLALAIATATVQARILDYTGSKNNVSIHLSDQKLRIDIKSKASDQLQTLLFLNQKKTAYFVDHEKKEFYKLDEKKIKTIGKTLDNASAMMQMGLQNLPPAMQEKIKKNMAGFAGGKKEAPTEIKLAGKGVRVKSWKTNKYQVVKAEKVESEIWAAPFESVNMKASEMKILDKMVDFFSSASKSILQRVGDSAFSGYFGKVPGLPVKLVSYTKQKETMTLNKIGKSSSRSYTVPKGYAEKDFSL